MFFFLSETENIYKVRALYSDQRNADHRL